MPTRRGRPCATPAPEARRSRLPGCLPAITPTSSDFLDRRVVVGRRAAAGAIRLISLSTAAATAIPAFTPIHDFTGNIGTIRCSTAPVSTPYAIPASAERTVATPKEDCDAREAGIRAGNAGRMPHAIDGERRRGGDDGGEDVVLDPGGRDRRHDGRFEFRACHRPPRSSGVDQTMYCPPFAVSVEPVMKPASSDARKTTQRAISSGSPRRPSGICGRMFFSSTSFGTALTISVAI